MQTRLTDSTTVQRRRRKDYEVCLGTQVSSGAVAACDSGPSLLHLLGLASRGAASPDKFTTPPTQPYWMVRESRQTRASSGSQNTAYIGKTLFHVESSEYL